MDAIKQTVEDIKKRMSAEEIEYNKAKLQEELKKRQYDILAFENSLTSVEKIALEAATNCEKVFEQFRKGQAGKSQAYEAAIFAKDQCEKVRRDLRFIKAPDGLPKDIDNLLSETKNSLISSYTTRIDAFENLLKFIEENNPGYQAKFYQDIKLARSISSGVALNIVDVKREMGIEIVRHYKNILSRKANLKKDSYSIGGIYFSDNNHFAFIEGKIYRTNDAVAGGKIVKISPDKITLEFSDGSKEYTTGDCIEPR